jgi:hypothetical protein
MTVPAVSLGRILYSALPYLLPSSAPPDSVLCYKKAESITLLAPTNLCVCTVKFKRLQDPP